MEGSDVAQLARIPRFRSKCSRRRLLRCFAGLQIPQDRFGSGAERAHQQHLIGVGEGEQAHPVTVMDDLCTDSLPGMHPSRVPPSTPR